MQKTRNVLTCARSVLSSHLTFFRASVLQHRFSTRQASKRFQIMSELLCLATKPHLHTNKGQEKDLEGSVYNYVEWLQHLPPFICVSLPCCAFKPIKQSLSCSSVRNGEFTPILLTSLLPWPREWIPLHLCMLLGLLCQSSFALTKREVGCCKDPILLARKAWMEAWLRNHLCSATSAF